MGSTTYVVKTSPTSRREVHLSQLKPYVEDVVGRSWPLYYTAVDDGSGVETTPGEYNVEKIVAHKSTKTGGLQFLVKWEGYNEEENTWEDPEAFLPRYCKPWAKYCRQKGLKVDILKYLKE